VAHNRWRVAAAIVFLIGCAGGTVAQTFPTKPLRLVVPYPPGGITDILGRALGQALGERLGQSIVIDNRAGANGAIGSEVVARAAPDGYSLVVGASSTHVLNPLLYKLGYDPVRDFSPIGLIAATPLVLVVSTQVPAATVPELVSWLKARAGQVNFGSYGNASASHLAGELFKSMAGIQMTHVPYRGAAPAQAAIVGGEIALMFSDMSAMELVRAGRLRALALTGLRRTATFPEIPTVAEAGVPGFEVSGWFAIYGPAGIAKPVVDRLSGDLAKIIESVEIRKRLVGLGLEPASGGPADLAALMRRDREKWIRVIAEAKIKVD